jgi:hypothetical protein
MRQARRQLTQAIERIGFLPVAVLIIPGTLLLLAPGATAAFHPYQTRHRYLRRLVRIELAAGPG